MLFNISESSKRRPEDSHCSSSAWEKQKTKNNTKPEAGRRFYEHQPSAEKTQLIRCVQDAVRRLEFTTSRLWLRLSYKKHALDWRSCDTEIWNLARLMVNKSTECNTSTKIQAANPDFPTSPERSILHTIDFVICRHLSRKSTSQGRNLSPQCLQNPHLNQQ